MQLRTHNYTRADWLARDHGLRVLRLTAAALPAGIRPVDHYGNWLTAETVWIGTEPPATEDWRAVAFGTSVHSIHQQATPGVGEALLDIAEAILQIEHYGTRAALEAEVLRYSYGKRGCGDALDNAATDWRDWQVKAHRARVGLPAAVFERLPGLFD